MMRRALPAFTIRPMQWAIHTYGRFARPLTLGVRAVVFDRDGRVLLLRHSYVPGWHFPGGGVEPGETAAAAATRELREEAGLAVEGELTLHGLFYNRRASRRDHVAVFVVRSYSAVATRAPDWEILETGFFDPAALPEGATPASRARLGEILDGVAVAELW